MILTPGRATLAEWRAVHGGAATPPRLDPGCRPAVEAGAAAVAAFCAQAGSAANNTSGNGASRQAGFLIVLPHWFRRFGYAPRARCP